MHVVERDIPNELIIQKHRMQMNNKYPPPKTNTQNTKRPCLRPWCPWLYKILCTETCIKLLVTAIFKLGTRTLKDSKTDFELKPKCCAFYAATSDSWSINSHNTSETCTEHGGSKHVAIYSRNISTTLYSKKNK